MCYNSPGPLAFALYVFKCHNKGLCCWLLFSVIKAAM